MKEIYLAGGCFWGMQKYMDSIPGVVYTEVGYANGKKLLVTYEEVCRGTTGHAETVKVEYDTSVIDFRKLLFEFFYAIDPTSLGRQGADIGKQYRTGIYYTDEEQKKTAKESLLELQEKYDRPIVVELLPLNGFCIAESVHQKYLEKNPKGYCHINFAKIEKEKNRIVDEKLYKKKSRQELQKELSPLQYAVTEENFTEPPFNNLYWNETRDGIYVDITTGEPLFSSDDKFDSGCGWPSFSKPIDQNAVCQCDDISHDMIRTEVRSRVGNIHLGHIFDDGPKDMGGQRYCINSAAIRFVPRKDMTNEGYGYILDAKL